MLCCLDNGAINAVRMSAQIFGPRLVVAQLVCCLAWLFILFSLVGGRSRIGQELEHRSFLGIVISLPVYTFLIHSFFEAGSRHMEMHIGAWLILMAAAWGPAAAEDGTAAVSGAR
jgi:hypothetical protein